MAVPSRRAPSMRAAATSLISSRSPVWIRRRRSATCATSSESARLNSSRLAFADIMVPHQGPAAQAVEVALRMLEAGVDVVGVHLQADARRADPTLIESHYLDGVAGAI